MVEASDLVHIPYIDDTCRFWMIRTKSGYFYDEFIRNEFIAIGWNYLLASTLRIDHSVKQKEKIKQRLENIYGMPQPGSAYNKCKRFFSEIKVGDIGMIVDNTRISFVYIGEYYEQKDDSLTIELEKEVDKKIEGRIADKGIACPYVKRRKIHLIKTVQTKDPINPYLFKAMAQNRHSISSLDDYSKIVLSSCFDIYQKGNDLAVTFRVESTNEISPLDFADFLQSASRILRPSSDTQIAVNTNLHSPGEITILTHIDPILKAIPLLFVYVAIVGGKFKDTEIPSIIEFVRKELNFKRNKRLEDIELKSQEAELHGIELDNQRKEYENRILEQRLKIIEENMPALQKASGELEIRPFDDNIISFNELRTNVKPKK